MNSSSLLQIVLGIAGVVVIYTLASPMYSETIETTDSIARVQSALNSAAAANQELQSKAQEYNAVAEVDKQRLNTYLPDEVDELRVVADLLTIANSSNVAITSYAALDSNEEDANVEYLETETNGAASGESPERSAGHRFGINIDGDYDNVKTFLSLLHVNNYPMVVETITTGAAAEGEGQASAPAFDEDGQPIESGGTAFKLQILVPQFTGAQPMSGVTSPGMEGGSVNDAM